MHLIRLNSYLQKEWKTLVYDKTSPTLLHLKYPTCQKKIISNVSLSFSLKKPRSPPFIYISEQFSLPWFYSLATGAGAGVTNVSDSGFSRVTETFREQIRVNQPLQEQECADKTGCACSANVLLQKTLHWIISLMVHVGCVYNTILWNKTLGMIDL